MNQNNIQKTEQFLKETFQNSSYLQGKPKELAYRLEHSYRVANIGKKIAEKEGFDPELMVIACLLHDISYCKEMNTREERMEHGRKSAEIAEPFLNRLGLPPEGIKDILYGIAIHVDDRANFEWRRTAFAETVSDADNIDRFDAYRIYETLEYQNFSKLPLEEKMQQVQATLERLGKHRELRFATHTAKILWQQQIDYYSSFYEKLRSQLENSAAVL